MEANRFADLLNPIRDLARNWDVDIAQCLEEYLDELGAELGGHDDDAAAAGPRGINNNGSITTSSAGAQQPHLNFAEAALLIQGSAAVYSKKVEYVYALVYQTLQHITAANKKDEKGARAAAHGGTSSSSLDDSTDLILSWGDDPSLLVLDDDDVVGARSSSSAPFASRIDMHAAAPAHEAIGTSLPPSQDSSYSQHRSHMSSSALMQSMILEDPGRSGLNMLSCRPDATSGALEFAAFGPSARESLMGLRAASPLLAQSNNLGDAPRINDGDDFADDCGGMDDGGFDDFGSPGGAESAFLPAPSANAAAPAATAAAPRMQAAPKLSSHAVAADPLALLDPHSASVIGVSGSASAKPLRVGKCYRVPATMAKIKNATIPIVEDEFAQFSRSFSRQRTAVMGLAAGNHLRPVLSRIRKETFLSSLARRRSEHTPFFIGEDDLVFDAADALVPNSNKNGVIADEDASFGDDDHAGDWEDNYDNDDTGPEEFSNDLAATIAIASAEELPGRVEKALSTVVQIDGSTATTFEDLCKYHMENFLHNAESYARETELSRRIGDWISKLEPKLAAEETRNVFDIAKYADKVLTDASVAVSSAVDVVPSKSKESETNLRAVDFSEIVENNPRYEVCRVFTACLQLANLGNIDIIEQENSESFKFNLTAKARVNCIENFRVA